MDLETVLENLCVYDPRSPFYPTLLDCLEPEDNMPEPRNGCYCDACFSGRDRLALEILRLRALLQ